MVDHDRNRQPTAVLVRWINSLGIRPQPGNAQLLATKATLHAAFQDGQTLLALLKRVAPEAETELSIDVHKRCLSEAATLHNLERGLSFVWRSNPTARNMPTALNLYAGHTAREAVLRFVDELFAVYVERPARRQAAAVLSWADRALRAYGRGLSGPSLAPPFRTLPADFHSGVSLGCLLHHAAQLGSGEPPDLSRFYWEPCGSAELEANLEHVQPRLAARAPARDVAACVGAPESTQLLLVQLHALWLACAGTLPVVRWGALVRYRDHDRLLQRYADQLEAARARAEAEELISDGLDADEDAYSSPAGGPRSDGQRSESRAIGAGGEDDDGESHHADSLGVRSPVAWDDEMDNLDQHDARNDLRSDDWLDEQGRLAKAPGAQLRPRGLSGGPPALASDVASVGPANLATAPYAWAASLRAAERALPPPSSQQSADQPRSGASATQRPWRATAPGVRARSPTSPSRRQPPVGSAGRSDDAPPQGGLGSGPAEWLLDAVQLLVRDRPACLRSRGLTTTADFSLGNECVPTAEASLGRMMPALKWRQQEQLIASILLSSVQAVRPCADQADCIELLTARESLWVQVNGQRERDDVCRSLATVLGCSIQNYALLADLIILSKSNLAES